MPGPLNRSAQFPGCCRTRSKCTAPEPSERAVAWSLEPSGAVTVTV